MQSKKLLVFPTSRAIRSYISKNDTNRFLPYLITIGDFFKKSIHVQNLKLIDDEHRFLLLKESTNIKNFSKLGISNTFNDFMKQSEYIFRFFNEISAEKVAIEDIQTVDTYEFYEEHLDILKKILVNYKRLLDKYGYVDRVNLEEHCTLNLDYLNQFQEVKIFFEGYFTNFEFGLLKEIAQHIPIQIDFLANEYNQKSYDKFKDLGFELEAGFHYILELSTQSILQKEPLTSLQQNIQVSAFRSRINQMAFVKHQITQMISCGLKASDIAVVVPDEKYTEMLQEFDKEEYFNYAMGKSIYSTHLYSHMDALYSYLNNEELKESEYIKYLGLEDEFVNMYLKKEFSKSVKQENFTQLIEYLKQHETDEELLEKFDESVYRLKKLLFTYQEKILFKEALRFLLQRTSQITLDDVNSGPITVMGLLETRGVAFKGVIIVDFNEEVVPKKSVKDKFLSTSIKRYAHLPTLKDRENLQKYYYTRLCQNAQHIGVCFVKNETSQISRFANELFACSTAVQAEDEKYDHILFKEKKFKHFSGEIVLNMDLSKQIWSATSLKVYLQCQRKYYLQYISKIKEHNFSLKPQNFELGSIVHAVLESFFKENSRIDTSVNREYFSEKLSSYQNKNPFLTLDLELWKKYLSDFVENEKKEFLKEKKVIHTELRFTVPYCGLTLTGSIDRVDKYDKQDYYEIIDYKTSASLSMDTLRNYEKSVDFQLEFYYIALQHLLKTDHLDARPYYYDLKNAQMIEESVLNEKLILLENIFSTFHTQSVNFKKCEEKSICTYCHYQEICNR